jgi:hypothetical protein
MTAWEQLRLEASRLRHAENHDIVFDSNGKLVGKNDYHYLTCVRCIKEKRANELEREHERTNANSTTKC